MDQLPRIVKDMMQVPLHLVGGRNRQVRIPGVHREGRPRSSSILQGPVWLELGTWDLEMAGVEGGAGLGKRQPETGMSDPDSARTRRCNPPKKNRVSKLLGTCLPIFLLDPIASASSGLGVSHHPSGTGSLDLYYRTRPQDWPCTSSSRTALVPNPPLCPLEGYLDR